MEFTAMEFGGAVIFALQLLLLFINLKVRADLAELKLHMYQHFVTKKDLQTFNKTGVIVP
ncbi:MAG: hypothetical protein ACRD22_00520 [Terriglobia bacterium]